jgi:hypothetical protein
MTVSTVIVRAALIWVFHGEWRSAESKRESLEIEVSHPVTRDEWSMVLFQDDPIQKEVKDGAGGGTRTRTSFHLPIAEAFTLKG